VPSARSESDVRTWIRLRIVRGTANMAKNRHLIEANCEKYESPLLLAPFLHSTRRRECRASPVTSTLLSMASGLRQGRRKTISEGRRTVGRISRSSEGQAARPQRDDETDARSGRVRSRRRFHYLPCRRKRILGSHDRRSVESLPKLRCSERRISTAQDQGA